MKFKSIKLILSVFISSILVSSCGASSHYYTVTFDSHGGSNVPSQKVVYGDKVERPDDPARLGYNFVNWTYQNEEWSFIGYSVTQDMTLDANWSIITYNVIYNLDGGTNDSNNPSTYTVEDNFTLYNPTKKGYTFLGWFNEANTEIKSLGQTILGDMTLTAHWSVNLNSLSVTSENTSKGTVAIISGSGYSNESITVVATPVGDCVFKGWYHESIKVSDDTTYSFIMPTNDYSLVAHFFTKSEEEEEKRRLGITPTLSEDGKAITYGLYPQTNVNDYTLISSLNFLLFNSLPTPEANGWYLYDGDYYAWVDATPYESDYIFDNGTTITSGIGYWFKCEPIVWNVLSNTNGEHYIVSSALLDAQIYHYSSSTNYEDSNIRTWLNEDFYNSAFTLGNEYIQTTTVDNTEDMVFLPIYKDYINSSYGFSTSYDETATRCCKTTDLARARGAYYNTSSSYLYNGYYWTRSPGSNYFTKERCVSYDGSITSGIIYRERYGVRPAITLKIA